MTNCPRCNAALDQRYISCTKCGKIYRNRVPTKLFKAEAKAKKISQWPSAAHQQVAASEALDRARIAVGS